MSILAVDPTRMDAAGSRLVDIGSGIGWTLSTLTGTLGDCSGMCGNDPVGEAMGHSYDRTANALVAAIVGARNSLVNLADGVRVSAFNYSVAEAQSDISGRSQALPTPPTTEKIGSIDPPSSVGSADSTPAGFGWVVEYIGMIWPNGDSEKLRLAAAAWISAGASLINIETEAAAQLAVVAEQQIPEGDSIAHAFGTSVSGAVEIMLQCNKIAGQLTSYANKIDAVHAAIIDLLSRICDPMTGIKIIWEFLTRQEEDEIRQIADDIKIVVENFAVEVALVAAELSAAFTAAEAVAGRLGPLIEKPWNHFLHGTLVGRLAEFDLHFLKGFGSAGVDLVKDGWKYGALRAALDPAGWDRDMRQLASGVAPLVGAGGEGAPGVAESWKQVGKDAVHWDLWKSDPGEAAGRTGFDIVSAVAGGAAAKAAKEAGALAKTTAKLDTTADNVASKGKSLAAQSAEGVDDPASNLASKGPAAAGEQDKLAEAAAATRDAAATKAPDTKPAAPEKTPLAGRPTSVDLTKPNALPQSPAKPHNSTGAVKAPAGATRLSDAAQAGTNDLSHAVPQGDATPHAGPDGGWHHENGSHLDLTQNQEADRLLERAHRAEPGITASVRDIAARLESAKLVGEEFRLKTAESLKEKLATSISDYPDWPLAKHISEIKDSVRYTLQMQSDSYSQEVRETMHELFSGGYDCIKFKNTWGSAGYQGVNSFWVSPGSGQLFEVQFHTPESFNAKMVTHELYEEARLPTTPLWRINELGEMQAEIFRNVSTPEGAPDLNTPRNGE